MARERRSRFWRLVRIYFRHFRITVLLVLLGLLCLVIYLNQLGLPDFVKRPVLEKLRARGLELEFSRMRFRWYRGIVADHVRFGGVEEPNLPRFSAQEAEIDLNLRALSRLQLQVDALRLRGGNLVWTIAESNAPSRTLAISDIEATLRLMPGDEWRLDDFRADFAGARFFLSGVVTNASAVRDWKVAGGRPPGAGPAWPERLRQLAETLERITFTSRPELRLILDGDARDWQSFSARFTLSATDADTPWGTASNLVVSSRLFSGAGHELSHLDLHLYATSASTPWADAARLDLELRLDSRANLTNLVDGTVKAKVAHAQTRWAAVTNAQVTAQWTHSLTNPVPLSASGELRAAASGTPWGSASGVRLAVRVDLAPAPGKPDPAWAWWTNLQPYQVAWDAEVTGLESDKLSAESVAGAGYWQPPVLAVSNLNAVLYDGAAQARAQLNVATRELEFGLTSDFNPQKIAPLLTPGGQRWLSRFTWAEAPHVRGSGALILPAWTNRQPDWRGEVQPTLRLAGEFAVTNGTFRGIALDRARSQFFYSNLVWRLPDLEAARPEGQVRIAHVADDQTKEFYFGIQGGVDPQALRPLLSTNVLRGLDEFRFTEPPQLNGELHGHWHDPERLVLTAKVALTNFAFREQTADAVVAQVRYTNRVIEFLEPRLWRGTQAMSASGITVDLHTQRIHFTNGFSTADPMVVARAIGPKTAKGFEPYQFLKPPTVRVHGCVPLRGAEDADLRFELEPPGAPFAWWKFRVPRIAGEVHWLNEKLMLTNLQTEFYWGDAGGHAQFDLTRGRPGTDFSFATTFTHINLPMLMADLYARSNHLEGWLSGQLVITQGNSDDPNSWQGHGRARLRDGLLWEIPVFGVLSKPLDSLVPGLGNSRVTDASARFKIGNGAIRSDDLEMRAPAMRLQYEGQVAWNGSVDARVEAELLRDTWLIGRVVSLALWPVTKMLEYKITGTLEHPKSEPLHIPKLLLAPLSPFQTLEDLFTVEPKRTNAPPVFKEP